MKEIPFHGKGQIFFDLVFRFYIQAIKFQSSIFCSQLQKQAYQKLQIFSMNKTIKSIRTLTKTYNTVFKSQLMINYNFSNQKVPRPRDPTADQTVKTKISKQQIQILMDPRGFMNQQQKSREEQNMLKLKTAKQTAQKDQGKDEKNQYGMEPEYGFKPKGPQPTRYGDWEVKGKCVDF